MIETTDELAQLEKEIRRIINDNEKFLSRVLNEDFSDDDEDETEDSDSAEEL